jgi:DNA-binding response OmpR family regulator
MILFIDDEPRYVRSYIEFLEDSGHEAHLETSIDEALRFFLANQDQIGLVILDVMLPPGELFTAAETEDGLRTGVHLFKKLREESRQLPIIILANVSSKAVEDAFVNQPFCRFLRKVNTFPFELVQEVENMLQTGLSGD